MRRDQTASGGGEHIHDLGPRSGRRLQPPRQRDAVDELHREEDASVEGADVEDCRDVRVLEPRHGACLVEQAPPAPIGADQFERDLPVELGIVGRIDRAHRADPDEGEKLVAPDQEAALRKTAKVEGLAVSRLMRGWRPLHAAEAGHDLEALGALVEVLVVRGGSRVSGARLHRGDLRSAVVPVAPGRGRGRRAVLRPCLRAVRRG
jgi:hypothetical protein